MALYMWCKDTHHSAGIANCQIHINQHKGPAMQDQIDLIVIAISGMMTLGGLVFSVVIGWLFCDVDCFDEANQSDLNSPGNIVG